MSKKYTFTTPYKDAYEIVDRDIDKAMKPEDVADLLNRQNQRIKELEGKILIQLNNNADNVNFMENQRRENQQLKQQLQDLPKKIVEYFYDEIRHRAILEDDYCPDHNLERKYGVRECLLEDIRTKILKKYGGNNESIISV